MKVITKIEFMECPDDIARVRLDLNKPAINASPFYSVPQTIKDEIVQGKKFTTPKGTFVLGITSDIAQCLGVALTTYDNIREENNQLNYELKECRRKFTKMSSDHATLVYDIKSANFLKRLKYLFTGKF